MECKNKNFVKLYNFLHVLIGHGIVAHRCIKEICKLVGIKDIHVKCEGDVTNYRQVTRAFVLGLLRQRTYQELANEKQLHLVELREERFNYPEVCFSLRKYLNFLPWTVFKFSGLL